VKPKTWEAAWQERHSHELWSVPDPKVVALLETLRGESAETVLDLGFGLGRHVILFAGEGFDTYGIEPTRSWFAYCEEWLEAEGLRADIRIGEMTELPYENGFFDFVLSWNVIYHGTRGDGPLRGMGCSQFGGAGGGPRGLLDSSSYHWMILARKP
jgi:tellurite methyltransferase